MKKRNIANSLIVGGICLAAAGIVLKRTKYVKTILNEAIKQAKEHCKASMSHQAE